MIRPSHVSAFLLAWLAGGAVNGEPSGAAPARWESPPGLLNLRLPPPDYAASQIDSAATGPAQPLPPFSFPRPDYSKAPWGLKADFGPIFNLAPPVGRMVTVVPPASQFVGPNCGWKCAEKRAQSAGRTERRLW